MAKTALERLNSQGKAKLVLLEKNFAGVKAGDTLFVATPKIIDGYIRSIPRGQQRSVDIMRKDLAREWKADATCPASTAIFLHIAAQAAIEEMDGGKPVSEVCPFWRVVLSSDKVAQKLTIDAQWIDLQRASEGICE